MREHSPEAVDTKIDPENLEARLMDRAMRMEVNYQRCLAGIEPVMESDDLALEATMHAMEQVLDNYEVTSTPVPGKETPAARAAHAGFAMVALENSGWLPWMDVMGGGTVQDKSLGKCGYRGADGQMAGAFTYAGFARATVTLMMQGGEGRSNLLSPDVVAMGTGVAHDPQKPYCGTLFFVHMLAG